MNCPFCNGENPENAVFCKHCGKKLDQIIICPVCKKTCASDTRYCSACGTELNPVPPTSPAKQGMSERTRNTLRLTGGGIMLAAVFFALVFAFFIGTTQTVTDRGYSDTETYTVWHYFGRAYSLLKSTSAGQNFSPYATAAHYIPVVLSTVIAAATLVSVVSLSLAASVKFGLYFKRPNNYYKYAVAAVFTFWLGASLFDCIHSVSTEHEFGRLSGTTVAGITLTALLFIASFILKTAAVGKDFRKKQTTVDCVLTLAGILLLAFVAGFAKADQADFTASGTYYSARPVSYFRINADLSRLFGADTPVTSDYIASFTLCVLAATTQISMIVLTFIALILRAGNFTEKQTYTLGVSIALAAVAAVNVVFGATAIELTNSVVAEYSNAATEYGFAAAPALAFVFSLLHLAVSVTHRVLGKKEPPETETTQS